MARGERRIRRAVEVLGGRLLPAQGSRVMAFFANGSDALLSAIEMQRRVADLPPHSGFPLAVRVGLCAGHHAREGRFFPISGDNPAASLSIAAMPGRILLSVPKRAGHFPWRQMAAERVSDLALNCGNRQLGIFEVAWQVQDRSILHQALANLGMGNDQLIVSFGISQWVLDMTRPIIRLGRHPDADVAVHDLRCSRQHATIERRLDRIVLVDRSTNGTFVRLGDHDEIWVRHRAFELAGSGQLSLGASSAEPGAAIVKFQVDRRAILA